jgi:arylsulfatase A-like enzyme
MRCEIERYRAEGKPEVQRNYSKHWCFSSYTELERKKLIAMYWGFTTLIDEQIGRVMETLRRLGLEEDTLVVFTTDHGSFEGHHKLYDKGPAMYEDTYRIPLIMKDPGVSGGRMESRFVSLLDLTATFVDEATGKVPEHYDGQSLLPLLRQSSEWEERSEMFAEFHGHHFPYPQRMIRSERYKLVVNPPDINEFYDLEKDPSEMRNLIDSPETQETISDHYRRLFEYLKNNGDNFYHWMYTMFPVSGEMLNESARPYMAKA